MDRIRGSSGRELQQRVPQDMRRMGGDGQRWAIERVREEEAGAYNSRLAPFGVFWNPSFKI